MPTSCFGTLHAILPVPVATARTVVCYVSISCCATCWLCYLLAMKWQETSMLHPGAVDVLLDMLP